MKIMTLLRTNQNAVRKRARSVLIGLTVLIVAAYGVQFIYTAGQKGQGRMGKAFETIGFHAMQKQYKGVPEMRVVRAFAEPIQCELWNFEQTWGRCVVVGLDVRDYHAEQRPILDEQVRILGEKLSKPCVLLPNLKLPDESEIARNLTCDKRSGKSFKLEILVTSVRVLSDLPDPANPHMWWATDHKIIASYHFKGEL